MAKPRSELTATEALELALKQKRKFILFVELPGNEVQQFSSASIDWAKQLVPILTRQCSHTEPLPNAPLDPSGILEEIGVYTIHLSGEQFEGRQEVLKTCTVGELLLLIREPDNAHDPNAIRVCREGNRDTIGYVSAKNAAWLAPIIDQGFKLKAEIEHLFRDINYGNFINAQIQISGVPSPSEQQLGRRISS